MPPNWINTNLTTMMVTSSTSWLCCVRRKIV